MSVLSDKEIRKLCMEQGMISPFVEGLYAEGEVSSGLSSCGYDIRLSGKAKVFKNSFGMIVGPRQFRNPGYVEKVFDDISVLPHEAIYIPAHGYVLAESLEVFKIPRNISVRCEGKSTLARCGIVINVTKLEPGWEGTLVIEIANNNPCTAEVYAHEGIAQLTFELIHGEVEKSYADKNAGKAGKYQNQTGITVARV